MPKKFVVLRVSQEDTVIAYGPELKDRCIHWIEQALRLQEHTHPTSSQYEIKEAKIGWV